MFLTIIYMSAPSIIKSKLTLIKMQVKNIRMYLLS